MVRYSINDLKEGMVLGESIYSKNKRLLIAAGFHLKRVHIDLLNKREYSSVLIDVEGTEDVIPETIISEHVQNELSLNVDKSAKNIENIFQDRRKVKQSAIDIIKKNKEDLSQIIRSSGAMNVINKIIEDIISEPWTVLNLTKMQKANNLLFEQAINVTTISLCIGHKYHFLQNEMKQLGLGAVNCDLGMLAVSPKILNKHGELTEDEELLLQQHTVYGHMMLSDISIIRPTSSIMALSHHEHQDGSGYPHKIKGENRPPVKSFSKEGLINRFAEIIAVADAYVMFINGREHYSPQLDPKEAIKKLIQMKGAILNSEIVKTLVSMVPAYPVGTRIKIADSPFPDLMGYIGVVSKVDPDHLYEPYIIIFESKNHLRIKPVMLDLSKHRGFTIELLS